MRQAFLFARLKIVNIKIAVDVVIFVDLVLVIDELFAIGRPSRGCDPERRPEEV